MLFGTQNWQTLSYMPAQGLFNERKLNNFFQVRTFLLQQTFSVVWHTELADVELHARSGIVQREETKQLLPGEDISVTANF